ncbi:galactosylceramide sulfotransferase-like [Oratosquilla oratoria]|uniref:galactosylceramide sulfotransferase-like n=1 Tax=Oratosquilla oratoria TaxID=337810 RepID=UPI003F765859
MKLLWNRMFLHVIRTKCLRITFAFILLSLSLMWILNPPISEGGKLSVLELSRHQFPEVTKQTIETHCSPVINIGFLKTHKCASSTIQNMLYRYAWQHHLKIACPEKGNYFGRGTLFMASMAKNTPWNHLGYNIFATHTMWNHKEVASILPNNSVFFTIVREPVSQFKSLYYYMGLGPKSANGMKEFLRTHNRTSPPHNKTFGLNQMAFDLGIHREHMNNLMKIHEMVEAADKQFDLVMIAERMEESLILLKNLLCWSFEDVIIFKLNSSPPGTKIEVDGNYLARLKYYLKPDILVYTHFLKKFNNLVEQFGRDRMAEELKGLRQATKRIIEKCKIRPRSFNHSYLNIELQGYESLQNDDFCQKIVIEELDFLEEIRNRMKSYANATL